MTTAGTAPVREYEPESAPGVGRVVVRGAGEILVTAGLLILLFCVYQLFYSNIEAGRAQARVTDELEQRWATPKATRKDIPRGEGFALIRIPRLGRHWVKPVVEGVDPADLAKGVGHYPGNALPGAVGNFAVAGHRATHGEPFRDLNRLRRGDAVVVETTDRWFVYRVDRSEIVQPTDVSVVAAVPNRPGVKPTKRLLTLTTCNPRWASYQRLIVYGHLAGVQQKSAGIRPVLPNA